MTELEFIGYLLVSGFGLIALLTIGSLGLIILAKIYVGIKKGK